jgi:hypothetical protein
VLVTITYLLINAGDQNVISGVNYEYGPAHLIPVNLQRVFPKPILNLFIVLLLVSLYTVIGWLWSLLMFLGHRP